MSEKCQERKWPLHSARKRTDVGMGISKALPIESLSAARSAGLLASYPSVPYSITLSALASSVSGI
jgi:hypothetical protein